MTENPLSEDDGIKGKMWIELTFMLKWFKKWFNVFKGELFESLMESGYVIKKASLK